MESSAQSQESLGNQQEDQQEQDAGAQDGGVQDWSAHLEELRTELETEKRGRTELQQRFQETSQTLNRVQQAFSGKDEKAADPIDAEIAQAEQMLDYFLQEGIKAERQGIKMPLTILNGTKMAQVQIQMLQDKKANAARLAKIEGQVKRQSDPNFVTDERAFANIEGFLDDAISQAFAGEGEDSGVTDAQYNAVLKLIGDEIKDLKKESPGDWQKIRRNPALQRSMVQHFVFKSLPPRMRALLAEKELHETEQPAPELKEAFDEANTRATRARQAGNEGEFKKWQKIAVEIRQQMVGTMLGDAKQGKRSSLNQVLGAYR